MSTMTPSAICETLSAANDLSDDTLAPLLEYRSAKRRTGCPDDLETEIIMAARKCQDTAAELRRYLERAAKEATEALAGLDAVGTRFDRSWFFLDARHNAEQMGQRLRAEREQFSGLLRVWAAVADRIQATDEEKATAARERQDRLATRWFTSDMEKVRAAAQKHNVTARKKAEMADHLAALGVEP